MSAKRPKKTLEEQLEMHREWLKGLTFADLVYTAIYEAAGDDYDGCFTELGGKEHDITLEFLDNALLSMEEFGGGL